MSDFQRVLEILSRGPKYSDDLAEELHPGRRRINRTRGGPSGAQVAGNTLLGRLRQRGWVRQEFPMKPGPPLWFITNRGREIEENNQCREEV